MTPPTKPRVKVPDTIKAGEVIEVKTLITHPMETGQRKGADGNLIPRSIVNTLVARFDGAEVFRAELHPGISANPYIAFYLRVPRSGDLEVLWIDDASSKVVEKIRLEVAT
jgi:sulfur-oxidizing protein SoxZ